MEDAAKLGAGIVFNFHEDLRTVIASVTPQANAHPVAAEWVREVLAASGWGDFRINESAMTMLLSAFNNGTPVDALPIAERIDASASVSISDDGMIANLELTKSFGGKLISVDEILRHLADIGIAEGIDHAAIAEAVTTGDSCNCIIGHGRPAQDGADGFLERLIPEVRSRVPRVQESGQIDYRDLGDILVVRPGDELMRRHPPGPGIPGKTLLGAVLPANAGKGLMFAPNLTGVEISADDPDLLLAAIPRQPIEVRDGMIVEPVFTVPAVTMASGNIQFDGSVVITGDIAKGMSVKATGDIEVAGIVEMASLEAGGNITVKSGVIGALGKKEAATQAIKCGKSFQAGYTQNVRIEAGDCVAVNDTAIQCELVALNHIIVGSKGRGQIVGGHHQASLSVRAKVIGSSQRQKTLFDIGVNPAMHKHLLELAKQRDGHETQLLELSKLMDFAAKNPGKIPPDKREKAALMARSVAQQIAKLREEQEALNQKITLSMAARVVALDRIYEGVEVHLGSKMFRVPSEFTAVEIGLDERGNLGLLTVEKNKL